MRYVTTSIFLLGVLVIIVCGVYPLAVWTVGHVCFSFQAHGSMLQDASGKIIGSKLIAQPFTQDQYFHPRPSAAAYDASASASSSLAASNPALRARVQSSIKTLTQHAKLSDIPADMLTTSASGLDPHITLQNAQIQLARVAAAWVKRSNKDLPTVLQTLTQILQVYTFAPFGGLFGDPIVNVLELNLALEQHFG